MEQIPESDREKLIDLDGMIGRVVKALGLYWSPGDDEFDGDATRRPTRAIVNKQVFR